MMAVIIAVWEAEEKLLAIAAMAEFEVTEAVGDVVMVGVGTWAVACICQ